MYELKLMTAKEARRISDEQAVLRQLQENKEAAEKAAAALEAEKTQHVKWQRELSDNLRRRITSATEFGRTEATHILHTHNGRGPYSDPLYGDGFLILSEYRAEVKTIIQELVVDGFVVSVDGTCTEHESRTYDGEYTGTYLTYDTILTVKW